MSTAVPSMTPSRGLIFDMRITLGNIITFVLISAAILIGWGRMSDELEVIRQQEAQQQIINDKQLSLIQSMQVTQAQTTTIIQELDRRLSIVEDADGLTTRKH